MKKITNLGLIACLIWIVNTVLVFSENVEFNDKFDTDIVMSATDGWTLKTADGVAGSIIVEDYVLDSEKKALGFYPSGVSGQTLSAKRVFPARTGTFVIDFRAAFQTKGVVNLLYAYQDNTLLFAVTAEANKIGVWAGGGAYDNTVEYKTLLDYYNTNEEYHFNIAIDSEKQMFNVYINGADVLANVPLRNKITTGMTNAKFFQASDSKANWQLVSFGINTPLGNASVSNVSIENTPYVGKTVMLNYTYDGDADEDNSTVRWMYSDLRNGEYRYISGETEKSLKIPPYLAGKWIKAEITPRDGMFASGVPVYSVPVLDMSDKVTAIDKNSEYSTKNNAVWNALDGVLTLTTKNLTGATATITPTKNVTGTLVFETSIKNKNKDAANVFYVYKDEEYVFNINFNAAHIVLTTGTEPGAGYQAQNLVVNYTADVWYDIKAVINCETNTADFYVNGDIVYENLYLRSDLTTTGITKILSIRGSDSNGETYIKGLKLYGVIAPTSTATSAKIKDVEIYKGFSKGTGCARLDADLFDQFGEKIKDGGFDWELEHEIDGVTLTTDGILMIERATTEPIKMKAISKDNQSIVACSTLNSFGDFDDEFDKDVAISTTDGWTFKTADGAAGTIETTDYVLDLKKKALTFSPSGAPGMVLTAERAFPARNGTFVIDFETAFESKGMINLMYAYQESELLFALVADEDKIGVWTGNGNYDDTSEYKPIIDAYDINTAYHFRIAVNSEKQRFNMYLNGKAVLTNAPLRNKITTGMTKTSLFQASDSASCWQLLSLDIKAPYGICPVTDVIIDKTPYVGRTMCVNYKYADGAEDDFSIVRWLYSDLKNGEYKYIPGATEKSFTVTPFFAGKWIKAEVTPSNGTFDVGTPVYSSPMQDVSYKDMVIDETSDYITKNNAMWDAENATLTLKAESSLGAEATVAPIKNITGNIVFEASVKNKIKNAANVLYVYQDSGYVFNITFDASNINLFCSSVAGENNYLQKILVPNYTADKWYDIKAIIDTNSSTADFYVDGELVFEETGLRADLKTKGITKIFSFRAKSPDGETYIKDMKLYGVLSPNLAADSARIKDPVMYTEGDIRYAQLEAELLDQFGEKINDTGFDWQLITPYEGISLTTDGTLTVNKTTVEYITVQATSRDDSSIIAKREICIWNRYAIKNFDISASDGKPITVLDRNIIATASAEVICYFGSKDVTLLMVFYDAFGKLMYVITESGVPEYGVPITLYTQLDVKYNAETKDGYFKAFLVDALDTLRPLADCVLTAE